MGGYLAGSGVRIWRLIAIPSLTVVVFAQCQRSHDPTGGENQANNAIDRSFLNEPSGVPPAAMAPKYTAVSISACDDIGVIRQVIQESLGPDTRLTASDQGEVEEFLETYAAWYLPEALLKTRAGRPTEPFPKAEAPAIRGLPLLRAWTPVDTLRLGKLSLIQPHGGRGMVSLWYPLPEVRERLQDGAAGLWRGITAMRDSLADPKQTFGGTPVFLWAVVRRQDAELLDDSLSSSFFNPLSVDAYLPVPSSHRAGLLELFPSVPKSPSEENLPAEWRDVFTGPTGQQMAWLRPKRSSVSERTFSDAIEALVPIQRQGATVWIVIGLPLAQPHIPARH